MFVSVVYKIHAAKGFDEMSTKI